MSAAIQIRLLNGDDPPIIAKACELVGWVKPASRYHRYLQEQAAGIRTSFVATIEEQFAGYVTINWQPTYPGSIELHIPEIQDLNVLPDFRRRGIATQLLDRAEAQVANGHTAVAIGVGLHPGYNVAQRLYVKRGYIPDGKGITYNDRYVPEGAEVVVDDNLVLHFTKQLR